MKPSTICTAVIVSNSDAPNPEKHTLPALRLARAFLADALSAVSIQGGCNLQKTLIERIRELTNRLNQWRYEYYTQNAPTVADAVYDRNYDELERLENQTGIHMSNSPTQTVGYEGVKRGVPDIILPIPRGSYHGLMIEMKRERGGVMTEEQKWWIDQLVEQGYSASVYHGAESAIKTIEWYINLNPQDEGK